MITVACTN